MKDAVYTIKTLILLANLCIAFMVLGGYEESWSQNHTNNYDFFLYGTLTSIVGVFLIRSFTHEFKDVLAFRIFHIDVKERHLNRLVGYLFFGVLCLGVNSGLKWVKTLHLIFTGLAIGAAYLNLYCYQKRKIMKVAAIFSAVVGIGMFLWSFLGNTLTIAEGEAFAAIPIIIWIWSTTKLD